MIRFFGDEKPHLDYPCSWSYRLIGRDEATLRSAVAGVVEADEYRIVPSHKSRTGRYVSMRLTLTVRDEAHRISLFEDLKASRATLYVL